MVLLLWLENFLEQNLKDKCMVFCTPTFLPMILTLNPSVSASHQCTNVNVHVHILYMQCNADTYM